MSLIRKHGAVLQAWACLDLVYHNFGKCEPILKILSHPYSEENSLNIYDKDIQNTLVMLPLYRGKRLTIVILAAVIVEDVLRCST